MRNKIIFSVLVILILTISSTISYAFSSSINADGSANMSLGNTVGASLDQNGANVSLGNSIDANLDQNSASVSLGNTVGATLDQNGASVSLGNNLGASVDENSIDVNVGGINLNVDESGVSLDTTETNNGFLGFIQNIFNLLFSWIPFFS